MDGFAYWHAYFDSTFLSHPPKLSQALLTDLSITPRSRPKWPSLPQLPQLPNAYQVLQSFLLQDRSWTPCELSSSEVKSIQEELNRVTMHLQCEKKYGWEFWQLDIRRIQASVVHLAILIGWLVCALIPAPSRTLLQAKRHSRLVISMQNLERLVQQVLMGLPQFQRFLLSPFFSEEESLTISFLNQFHNVLHTLPKVEKPQLLAAPALMQYICLNNPLTLDKYAPKVKGRDKIRKGSIDDSPSRKPKKRQTKHHRQTQYNLKAQCKGGRVSVKITRPSEARERNGSLNYFEFNQSIRNNSGGPKEKKPTMTTQTKDKSNNSLDKSMTIALHDDSSFMMRKSVRYRKTSSRSMRVHTPHKIRWTGEREEVEKEREDKLEPVQIPPISLHTRSSLRNFQTGEGKGWGTVREQWSQRVAARLIQRLLLQ